MKKTLFFVLALALLTGCGGGGGGSSERDKGVAPKITKALIIDKDGNATLSFEIGDKTNFRVYATDPDLDIKTLYITEFFPFDSKTPFSGPIVIDLPPQPIADLSYSLTEPAAATGPVGYWKLEFFIEDKEGHQSNTVEVYALVSEASG